LPQFRAISVSGCVALRLALPGGVVTWFVTGFRISLEQRSYIATGTEGGFAI